VRPTIFLSALEFREGTRGYELRIGPFSIPQSSYLLAAAVAVGASAASVRSLSAG